MKKKKIFIGILLLLLILGLGGLTHNLFAWEYSGYGLSSAVMTEGGTIDPCMINRICKPGGSQTYTITPDTDYKIDYVLVDGVNMGAISTYTFTNVYEVHRIYAYFKSTACTITTSAGTGGSIIGGGSVAYGGSTTVYIIPSTGYDISSVTVDGVNKGTVSSYSFSNVTSDHTVSATFSAKIYQVTTSAGAGGNISSSQYVAYGQSYTIGIIPSKGYKIKDVIVNGTSVGARSTYTLSSIKSNQTVSATFERLTYKITTSTL